MSKLFSDGPFLVTLGVFLAACATIGFLVWQEKRPRQHLMPSLLPTTPVMLLAAIVVVLTAIHLIHIIAPGALPPQ